MLQSLKKNTKRFFKSLYFSVFLNDSEKQGKLRLIHDSGLFDLKHYNKQLSVPFQTTMGAIAHYLNKGYKQHLNPNPYFNTKYYMETYPDVRNNDQNPLYHFVVQGAREDRNPSFEFNTQLYMSLHKDEINNENLNPLLHFIRNQAKEENVKNGSPQLKTSSSGSTNGQHQTLLDLIKEKKRGKGIETLIELGFEFTPAEAFDEDYYLQKNPDLRTPDINPYTHYINQGWREDRHPNDWFDTTYYLNTYPDVKKLNIEPFTHYLLIGKGQGRNPRKPDLRTIQTYFDYLNLSNIKGSNENEFVQFEKYPPVSTDLRLIAFYLPQFHPIAENDIAWGKGFTEWTNVSKALPQFEGHYQPRLPGELGHYDLRLIDIQKRQIELAKNYGLHGFCYHYYWFGGKKALEKPLQQVLDNPELDFPFCINWANENWTKRWDGLDQEVILKQSHSPEDDIAFLENIKSILLDKRYIKVNGKPLLMVYRPQLFPDIKATVNRWRKHAQKIGIGDLYLVLTHSFDQQDPREIGFDAATEFAPNNYQVNDLTKNLNLFNSKYQGKVYDYKSAINYSISYKEPAYTKFRGVCPSWDNEARKPGKGTTFLNSSPQNYGKWLEYVCFYTDQHKVADEKIVFINAWNEWGESAYLEPDRKFGYAYLEATHSTLNKFNREKFQFLKSTQKEKKQSDTAVVLHLYYMDLWGEIKKELDNFESGFDLYVNVISKASIKEIQKIQRDYPNANIYTFENRGRDILPFLKILKIILPMKYSHVCKIHSKKSLHRGDGDQWRNHLIQSLIGSPQRIKESKELMNHGAGIVVAKGNMFSYKEWMGSNSEMIDRFAAKAGIKVPADFMFPAGSMFWFKPDLFTKMVMWLDESEFILEDGQLDGTIAHACERIVGLLCNESHFEIKEI